MNFKLTILVVLGVAIAGLFFSYNMGYFNKGGDNTTNPVKDVVNEPKNEAESVPTGDPKLLKQIIVDLAQQKAFLYENGQFVREFAISSGKSDTPTPMGIFSVVYKAESIYSKIAKCSLGYWVGFTPDGLYGFHEVPTCHDFEAEYAKLGKPASLGCVRLDKADAQDLYNWVDAGTPVDIR